MGLGPRNALWLKIEKPNEKTKQGQPVEILTTKCVEDPEGGGGGGLVGGVFEGAQGECGGGFPTGHEEGGMGTGSRASKQLGMWPR